MKLFLFRFDGDNDAGANGTAAFADSEAEAFLNGDRVISSTFIVTWSPACTSRRLRQRDNARHVGGAEIELGTVVVENGV